METRVLSRTPTSNTCLIYGKPDKWAVFKSNDSITQSVSLQVQLLQPIISRNRTKHSYGRGKEWSLAPCKVLGIGNWYLVWSSFNVLFGLNLSILIILFAGFFQSSHTRTEWLTTHHPCEWSRTSLVPTTHNRLN